MWSIAILADQDTAWRPKDYMLTLHPNILENDGIKQFAVLSFEEYGK